MIVCAVGFLAALALCNIASQILGLVPGLVVRESSSVCRYFKPGPVDWAALARYVQFVGTLLLSFVLVVQVSEWASSRAKKKSADS